jgi:NADPH:quinone reductase-like Zn-dependent oxidoreductase
MMPCNFQLCNIQTAPPASTSSSVLPSLLLSLLQISKLLGARVVAVTRGQDKAAYLQRLGADAVIDIAAPAAEGQRLHKLLAAAAPKGGPTSACSQDVVLDHVVL